MGEDPFYEHNNNFSPAIGGPAHNAANRYRLDAHASTPSPRVGMEGSRPIPPALRAPAPPQHPNATIQHTTAPQAAPLWAPVDHSMVVRPAPGPFLYESADPEELKRRDEERRERRRQRECERAQKREEKAKLKATEHAQKELRRMQSHQNIGSHHHGHHLGVGGAAVLKTASSFSGSLRRAFQAFKKPSSAVPTPSPAEEDEIKQEEQERQQKEQQEKEEKEEEEEEEKRRRQARGPNDRSQGQ